MAHPCRAPKVNRKTRPAEATAQRDDNHTESDSLRILANVKQATSIRSIRSLVPLLDRVLVQRIKAESKTASGIFLPEASVKELNEGKVLAVGPGGLDKEGKRVPMGVSTGDRVLIPQVGGNQVLRGLCSRFAVRRISRKGWRGGVPPLPGRRVCLVPHAARLSTDMIVGFSPRSTNEIPDRPPENGGILYHTVTTVRAKIKRGGVAYYRGSARGFPGMNGAPCLCNNGRDVC